MTGGGSGGSGGSGERADGDESRGCGGANCDCFRINEPSHDGMCSHTKS